jgi:hypothetical protein
VALISCARVRVGFTTEQVEAAMGRPREVRQVERPAARQEWIYSDVTLEIEQSRVTAVR